MLLGIGVAHASVDVVGVHGEAFLTGLQVGGGVDGGGDGKEVAAAELAVPAAEPVQALFLLLQLGQRVFADAFLFVQLVEVLAAVGVELCPFRFRASTYSWVSRSASACP